MIITSVGDFCGDPHVFLNEVPVARLDDRTLLFLDAMKLSFRELQGIVSCAEHYFARQERVENSKPEYHDVVVMNAECNEWEGCIGVVEDVAAWGVNVEVRLPNQARASRQLKHGQFRIVGRLRS